jgi:hypothetical protein
LLREVCEGGFLDAPKNECLSWLFCSGEWPVHTAQSKNDPDRFGPALRQLKAGDHVDRIAVAYGEPKRALRFLNDYQEGVEVLTAQDLSS